jgi:hypothetical protein
MRRLALWLCHSDARQVSDLPEKFLLSYWAVYDRVYLQVSLLANAAMLDT